MSIFRNILSAIFGQKSDKSNPASASSAANQIQSKEAASPTPEIVDIAEVLDKKAAGNSEKLDWRHSIVDLMKLVGIESSLSARKELADELGYSGDKSDSASMNIWLHKAVIKKISQNGGKVPADLLD